MEAFKKDDDALAARHLRPFAEKGDAEAQFVMANIYARGQGVSRNMELSRQWVLKAAKQWHPEAIFLLGIAALLNAHDAKGAYVLLYTSAALSIEQGNPAAAVEPKRMMADIAKRLKSADVAEAERTAKQSLMTRKG